MGEIFLVEFGRKFQDEHENVRHLTTANWIMAQADFERPHAGCDEMMGERRKGKGCDCWRFYANEMTGLMGEEHNKRGKTAFPQIFRKRTRLQEEKEMKTVYLVCSWNISSICSFIQKKKNVGPTRSASLMFHDKKWDRRSKKKKKKGKKIGFSSISSITGLSDPRFWDFSSGPESTHDVNSSPSPIYILSENW